MLISVASCKGYTNFFTNVKSYVPYLDNNPKSWAIIPAVRNAMTQYPSATHFFHLSQHALIMNPSLSLKSQIFDKQRLESIMMKDVPIVPPDSIIKTLSYLKEEDVDLIITQDKESLVPGSFIMKRSEWSTFLLDAWFDPLFRSYNFKQAEAHALVGSPFEHLSYVYWTFKLIYDFLSLSKGPHRPMASYRAI